MRDFKTTNHKNFNIALLKREPMFEITNTPNHLKNDWYMHYWETAGKEKLICNLMNYITCLVIKLTYLISDIKQLISLSPNVANNKTMNLL